jgi:hypothetical protein
MIPTCSSFNKKNHWAYQEPGRSQTECKKVLVAKGMMTMILELSDNILFFKEILLCTLKVYIMTL